MKLYLAVAVLMLAFVAYTEAQDADPSQDQMQPIRQTFTDLIQKAAAAFEDVQKSEFVVKAKAVLDQSIETITTKFQELTQ